MLADSHPNIVVSFQVNDENLMWSILVSYIYLLALIASHVWSVPFKKAPFYFSSISVTIDHLLYYNFLLGILHYAAYVCKADLWSARLIYDPCFAQVASLEKLYKIFERC